LNYKRKLCLSWLVLFMIGSISIPLVSAAVQDQHNQFQNVDLEWHNGDINQINSVYGEGQVVPFRYELIGLPGDTDIYLTIHYKCTKGGKNAYDFLATYDLTESVPIGLAGGLFADSTPLSTLTEADVDFMALAIPDDSSIDKDELLGSTQYFALGGDFVAASVEVVNIADPFDFSGDMTGDSEKSITLHFTTEDVDAADLQIVLAWGGHLAIGDGGPNWPLGMGSGSIPGAPYHQSVSGFVDINGNGEIDGGEFIGPGDRSIHNVFVVPEVAVGTIAAVASMFGALGLFALKRKRS